MSEHINLIGKSYTFEDGNSITITQIKIRDGNEAWVTYQTLSGPGIPRKYVMTLHEFQGHYGHLFGINSDNIEG
jgi:hypothetical protein